MSFSADVKTEMAGSLPDRDCCRAAQAYGMLEFGHAFCGREISLQTEHEAVADLYASLTSRVAGLEPPERQILPRRTARYVCDYPTDQQRRWLLERYGHTAEDVSVRLNRANLECDECARALLRGAFLVCGAVTDPSRNYHLEFSVPYYNLSKDLLALLREMDIPAKAVARSGSYVVYIKESERIEDCLTYLGAPHGALEMMNAKMLKSIRNDTNRRFNCENANIDKTVAASAAQAEALRRIERQRGLDSLPEELRELARLRLDNPDLSLRELGQALDPPLSRSGVNHRLERLLSLAQELKD